MNTQFINRNWRYIRYGEDGEELYDVRNDPHEWINLASIADHAPVKTRLREVAPKVFANPGTKLNLRKDLNVDGESFRWLPGQGNLGPVKPKRPGPKPSNAPGKTSRTNKKNVLFIVCDDLNTHVTPAGYDAIKTPNLGKLASEAMTFRRAFCQYPVCGPSRASFLHGLYPQTTGVLNNTADIRKTRPGTISPTAVLQKQRLLDGQRWKGLSLPQTRARLKSPGMSSSDSKMTSYLWYKGLANDSNRNTEPSTKGRIGRSGSCCKKQVSAKWTAQTPPGFWTQRTHRCATQRREERPAGCHMAEGKISRRPTVLYRLWTAEAACAISCTQQVFRSLSKRENHLSTRFGPIFGTPFLDPQFHDVLKRLGLLLGRRMMNVAESICRHTTPVFRLSMHSSRSSWTALQESGHWGRYFDRLYVGPWISPWRPFSMGQSHPVRYWCQSAVHRPSTWPDKRWDGIERHG